MLLPKQWCCARNSAVLKCNDWLYKSAFCRRKLFFTWNISSNWNLCGQSSAFFLQSELYDDQSKILFFTRGNAKEAWGREGCEGTPRYRISYSYFYLIYWDVNISTLVDILHCLYVCYLEKFYKYINTIFAFYVYLFILILKVMNVKNK